MSHPKRPTATARYLLLDLVSSLGPEVQTLRLSKALANTQLSTWSQLSFWQISFADYVQVVLAAVFSMLPS